MENNRLGPEKKVRIEYEDFKDKWVLVSLSNKDKLAGKLDYISGDKIGLLPYQKGEPVEGFSEFSIETKGLPHIIAKEYITNLRPTTRKSAEKACENVNFQEQTQKLSNLKARLDLEKELKKMEKDGKPDIVIVSEMFRLTK
jgi:hypothetical protein